MLKQWMSTSAERIEIAMPRRHLRVLPSLTRPSLFAGD